MPSRQNRVGRLANFWVVAGLLSAAFWLTGCSGSDPAPGKGEPTAKGKPVSHWIEKLKSTRPEDRRAALTALYGIGRNAKDAVPALIEVLKDPEIFHRNSAASILGHVGPEAKAAVPALIEALKDNESSVREHAIAALGSIGPEAKAAVPILIEALAKPEKRLDPRRDRVSILTALAQMGPTAFFEVVKNPSVRDESATIDRSGRLETSTIPGMILRLMGPEAKATVPGLLEFLKDKDPGLRRTAAFCLGQIGPDGKQAVPALGEALKDKDAHVQIAAARALWSIAKEQAAIPVLLQAMKSEQVSIRQEAVVALSAIGPGAKEAMPAVVAALADRDLEVRKLAFGALDKMRPATVPALAEGLKDERVRYDALELLGRIGPGAKAAVSAVAETLKDKSDPVRYQAAITLGKIGPEAKAAVPALALALLDEARRVDEPFGKGYVLRDFTAVALGQIGPDAKAAVPALIEVVLWRDFPYLMLGWHRRIEEFRAPAAEALKKIDPAAGKALVPAMIKLLKDKDESIRVRAAAGLAHLGPDAIAAVPGLIEALKDKNVYVREHAAEALSNIQTPAAKKTGVK